MAARAFSRCNKAQWYCRIGGTEYTLFSFFQRTKAIIAEAEHFISSEQLSLNDIESLERIHERLSEAEDSRHCIYFETESI